MVYMITYDLIGKEKDYPALYEAIKGLVPNVICEPCDSTLIIQSDQHTEQSIFNALDSAVDKHLKIVVVEINKIPIGRVSPDERCNWNKICEIIGNSESLITL